MKCRLCEKILILFTLIYGVPSLKGQIAVPATHVFGFSPINDNPLETENIKLVIQAQSSHDIMTTFNYNPELH